MGASRVCVILTSDSVFFFYIAVATVFDVGRYHLISPEALWRPPQIFPFLENFQIILDAKNPNKKAFLWMKQSMWAFSVFHKNNVNLIACQVNCVFKFQFCFWSAFGIIALTHILSRQRRYANKAHKSLEGKQFHLHLFSFSLFLCKFN